MKIVDIVWIWGNSGGHLGFGSSDLKNTYSIIFLVVENVGLEPKFKNLAQILPEL